MSASGGCGCGGSSAAVAVKGGCECGGSCGCEVSMAGEGFVRPRFFGGMLLTEDDLQAAVDYAAAKRKLTNRHVIGAGVVCGLEVTCHTCDPGKVNVSPGYAIECCGNDIVVSCPEEVDIIELVRDLRLRTGVDCGEPCDDRPRQDYYLYVRYAETPTAPVAPYASDDCATGECEFSRIREGYCFELRCDPPADELTILDALEACRPDERILAEDTRVLTRVVQLAATFSDALGATAAGEPIPLAPVKSDFDTLTAAEPVPLDEGVALLTRATHTLAVDAAAAKGTARSPRLNTSRRTLIAERSKGLAARLRASEELQSKPAIERDRIERILATAEAQPDLSGLGPLDRAMLASGTTVSEAEREFVVGAEQIRGRVLRELSGRGQTTCDEYRKVSSLRFDRLTEASKDDSAALAQAYLRSIAACTCSAFNPPCPTCTDDAVVLAKVRVDGCDVIDVCALERHWVLTPRALGYWIPVVEKFRQCLQQACCEPTQDARERRNALECMDGSIDTAVGTVERAFSDAAVAPTIAMLRRELGELPLEPVPEAPAATAPPPNMEARTSAATASAAGTERSIRALEAKVEALGKQLAELSAGADTKEDEQS